MDTTYRIVNLGCKVNRIEADEAAALLESHGWRAAGDEASFVIVNTCTVTSEAEAKSRKAVRHARSLGPEVLWVTGCDMAIHREHYSSIDPAIVCVEKDDLLDAVTGFLQEASVETAAHACLRVGDAFRTRVALKIQDGCDHACTYCIVHTARGPARSIPSSKVEESCRAYLDAGVREIILSGIDVGSYACPESGIDLTALLRLLDNELARQEHFSRIRLSSIEPASITDELIEILAMSEGRICRHIHLPLQSGSDRILHAMNRPYDAYGYRELVAKICSEIPSISLTTDVIVGFPGETEDDFQETMRLCREVRFSKMHVFPYSPRAGTPAAEMEGQIHPVEKARRAALARELSDELAAKDQDARVDSSEYMLVEQPGHATSESYHRQRVDESYAQGELVSLPFRAGSTA